jgi:hypothetical protein
MLAGPTSWLAMNTNLETRLMFEVLEQGKTLVRIEERLDRHLRDDETLRKAEAHRKETRRASIFSIVAMLISAIGVWIRFRQ